MVPIDRLESALRRRWWLYVVLVTALAAVAMVTVLNIAASPRYRTSARYLVMPAAMEDLSDAVDSVEALDDPVVPATYAEVFNSPTLQGQVMSRLGVADSTAYEFATVVLPETSVLQLTVTGPDPQVAQGLANGLGEVVLDYMAGLPRVYQMHALDAAPLVEEPFSPQPLRDAAIALVLGALVGAGLVLAYRYLAALAALPRQAVDSTVPSRQPMHLRQTQPIGGGNGRGGRFPE
jgi:capsular polysaccharide biosynthesis protein